jgi:E3 ubiquitin-protein ligase RNF144
MDPETAKCVVELQLADISGLFDSLYNEANIPNGDARTSFQIMRRDLEQQLQILQGQVYVLNVLRQEHASRVAFARLLEEEKQAVNDHQFALELNDLAKDNPHVEQHADDDASLCSTPECCSDEQWDMAQKLYAAAVEPCLPDRALLNDQLPAQNDDMKGTTKAMILGSNALTKCCACMEIVSSKNTLTLACKPEAHTYCRSCLIELFTSALGNTSLFPPRCCRVPVSLETCCIILLKELINNFDLKADELATLNPTYCSNADCSKFIRPIDIKADLGSCVFCKDKTCFRCKGPEHNGLSPSDPHVQLLMDVARRSRWQQCTRCRNMVELEQGCFHMT